MKSFLLFLLLLTCVFGCETPSKGCSSQIRESACSNYAGCLWSCGISLCTTKRNEVVCKKHNCCLSINCSTSSPTKQEVETLVPFSKSPSVFPTNQPVLSTSQPIKLPTSVSPTSKSPTSVSPTSKSPTSVSPTRRPEAIPTYLPTPNPTFTPTRAPLPIRFGLLNNIFEGETIYAADPNALVVDETIYVFCSRDPSYANTNTKYNLMRDYVLITGQQIGYWTNHGVVFNPRIDSGLDSFTGKLMFAPGALFNAGWFYLYFPYLQRADGAAKIGVARSKTPHMRGTWTVLDSQISNDLFDPSILFNPTNNQYYIYGNVHANGGSQNAILAAKLNDDLVSIDGQFRTFGLITEGVFVFYRNGLFYFVARNEIGRRGDGLYYWISTSFMPSRLLNEDQNALFIQSDAPAHASIIKFKNGYYIFYHQSSGNRWKRSSCVDEIKFAADNTILPIQFSCNIEH